MTVKELRVLLYQFPDDLPVRFSYSENTEDDEWLVECDVTGANLRETYIDLDFEYRSALS